MRPGCVVADKWQRVPAVERQRFVTSLTQHRSLRSLHDLALCGGHNEMRNCREMEKYRLGGSLRSELYFWHAHSEDRCYFQWDIRAEANENKGELFVFLEKLNHRQINEWSG